LKNKASYWVALIAVLSGAASTSQAITLGDLRGSAVIGRTLDVTVPVSFGAGEEAGASCLSAEALLGDAQRLSVSVTVLPVATGTAPVSMVRIRSNAVVDEPVVTVALRSTCGGLATRQYVLLSDFPAPDLPRVAAAPVQQPLPPGAALPQAEAGSGLPAPDAMAAAELSALGAGQAEAADVAPKPVKPVKKRPKPRPAAKPVPPPAPPEPELVKPVLKLDTTPVLPVAAEPPASAAVPALVAASALSDEAAQQAARIEALQGDIKVLKDLAMKNEAALADLQVKLHEAETGRVSMVWLYVLGGLLVASLGALTWALRRQQVANKGDDLWWEQVKADPSETLAVAPMTTLQSDETVSDFGKTFERVEPAAPVSPAPAPHAHPQPGMGHDLGAKISQKISQDIGQDVDQDLGQDIDLDIDLDSLTPSDAAPTASQPLALVPADGFATTHNLNVESVSDIRQQAEFFVSLGQTERAMNVLRKQIMESPQPNPLVYLDLLALYHSQGLKTDYLELRAAFGRFFNGVVPEFSAFPLAGSDLLDYPEPLAVLVRFWPNIEAIAFLEACIFRNDAAPMQLSFDLAAFRDLLMLHAVAEKVTSDSPWKMTHLEGLGPAHTGPAELAGLAMVMDMRGKTGA